MVLELQCGSEVGSLRHTKKQTNSPFELKSLSCGDRVKTRKIHRFSVWGNGSVNGVVAEPYRAVPLVTGSCAMLDREGQITISAQAQMRPSRVSQRTSVKRETRMRPRHPNGYQRTADYIALLNNIERKKPKNLNQKDYGEAQTFSM